MPNMIGWERGFGQSWLPVSHWLAVSERLVSIGWKIGNVGSLISPILAQRVKQSHICTAGVGSRVQACTLYFVLNLPLAPSEY